MLLAMALAMALLGMTTPPPAHAVLTAVGPTDGSGFSASFTDANGLQLNPCTSPANCLAAPAHLFFFGADANLGTSVGSVSLIIALQGSYFPGPDAVAGTEVLFQRIRIRGTLAPNTTYTMTHPFGSDTITTDAGGKFSFTDDVGCIRPPCASFAGALNGRIGPFLKWDPLVAPAAPVGFLGTYAIPHKVVGSPTGNNVFRVTGPNVGGAGVNTAQTDQFNLMGELPGGAPAPPAPAPVPAGGAGAGAGAAPTAAPAATTVAATVAQVPAVTASTVARAAKLSVALSNRSLAFGAHPIGRGSVRTLTVRNTSASSELTIRSVRLLGGKKAFRIVQDDCTFMVLAAGDSCSVVLGYRAREAGTRGATLAIRTSPNGMRLISLRGSGRKA